MRKLFVVGDSISIQYGPFLKAEVEQEFHYDRKRGEAQALVNLDKPVGANGGDSARVLEYLSSEREQGVRYDILLVNCGLHDIKTSVTTGEKQVSAQQYKDNLEQIVETARSMSNHLIWITTTDVIDEIHNAQSEAFHRFHSDVLAYNAIAADLMARHEVPVIDLYTFTQAFGAEAYRDHAHFTEEVQRQQAGFIAKWLFEAGFHLAQPRG
ncbi:SGNH/GDSL hydrolase family protein [Paenibacillus sp. PL2-23]|uniref:SGNH/GDSL hydrolase family protein n=1 Tax=Paenibacillus sp. PL2-23 TaxID=2100729 RepID=UPI0030FA5566